MPGTFLNSKNFNTGPGGKLQIKLLNNFEQTIKVINKLSPEIKRCSIKAQLKVCQVIEKAVKTHLLNQDLNWRKLSSKYAKRKRAKGRDSRTLLSTLTYYNSITTWQPGNQHVVMVGVKSGIYTRGLNGKKSRLEVAKIAALHEFSTGKRLPKRPLWNPTIAQLGGSTGIKKLYVKHLVATLRRNGIPIKTFMRL